MKSAQERRKIETKKGFRLSEKINNFYLKGWGPLNLKVGSPFYQIFGYFGPEVRGGHFSVIHRLPTHYRRSGRLTLSTLNSCLDICLAPKLTMSICYFKGRKYTLGLPFLPLFYKKHQQRHEVKKKQQRHVECILYNTKFLPQAF